MTDAQSNAKQIINGYEQAAAAFADGWQGLMFDSGDRRHARNQQRRLASMRKGGLRGKIARAMYIATS
jgi:hypothetical protein